MDSENEITLGVLTAIQSHRSPTQRAIASEVGIALGLANSYLRRCVSKGYIKISQAPANRYMYYLTPKGFAEKSRLTAEFLRQSFSLFRQAREQYGRLFAECRARGWDRVGLYGLGDLCDIAVLCAHESRISIAGIIDPAATVSESIGLPVKSTVLDLLPVDAVVLTDMRDAQGAYQRILKEFAQENVLVPALLEVGPVPVEGVSEG